MGGVREKIKTELINDVREYDGESRLTAAKTLTAFQKFLNLESQNKTPRGEGQESYPKNERDAKEPMVVSIMDRNGKAIHSFFVDDPNACPGEWTIDWDKRELKN